MVYGVIYLRTGFLFKFCELRKYIIRDFYSFIRTNSDLIMLNRESVCVYIYTHELVNEYAQRRIFPNVWMCG